MKMYKVIFAKNEVISCQQADPPVSFKGDYNYEWDKGQLIYALIRAENEAEAIGKSDDVVREFLEKIYGKDFIQ